MRPVFLALTLAVMVAVAPNPAFAAYLVETVDATMPTSGIGSSLGLDSHGVPHIAYLNTDANSLNGSIRYASKPGANWIREQIDTGPVDVNNGFPELVVGPTDRIHVAYARSIVVGVGTVLRYAFRGNGIWARETITSGAYAYSRILLAVDANDQPHVLYLESDGFTSTLYYGTRSGGGAWTREVLSTDVSALPAALGVDAAGEPIAIFKTGFPTVLKAATRQGGSWSVQPIDASANLVATDIRLALDAAGIPYVSYRNYNTGECKLATRIGGAWSIEPTPADAGFAGGLGGLAVAADGTVVIGFATTGVSFPYATKVRVARRVAGVWSVEIVEGSQAPIGPPDVALDAEGNPKLSYAYSVQPFVGAELHYAQFAPGLTSRTLKVPADYATIQAAIDAAAEEDTVLVSPGLYDENLNFKGKAVVVRSVAGPNATIVDGGGRAAVVTIKTGEDARSILEGFTLRNGRGTFDAGGVDISDADPIVRGNVITGNFGSTGAGISIYFGSPTIEENIIHDNNSGSWGGGVSILGSSTAKLLRNRIEHNVANYDGGGIYLNGAGTPEIRGNWILDNQSYSEGGGILMYNHNDALIADNVIARNHTGVEGGGISWLTPSGTRGPYLLNNTFADNTAQRGTAIMADGYDGAALIANNVLVGAGGEGLLYSGNFNDAHNPSIHHNDVFPGSGSAYGGLLSDLTGTLGNVSVNPAFVDRSGGNYRLLGTSPVIDRGDNTVPGLGSVDADRQPRVADGDNNGTPTVDMGAFEFAGAVAIVIANAGPDRTKECAPVPAGGTAVVLDGTQSVGENLTYRWSAPGVTFDDASLPVTTGFFPTGITTVALEVSNGDDTDRDSVLVSVVDTTPPLLEVSLDPALLWPPNGRMVPIHATVAAGDACGGNVIVSLVSIESTEPVAGDVEGASFGAADLDFALRAERDGDGPGRFYSVTYEARDESGNTARSTVQVFVPHDQSGRAALAQSSNPPMLTIFASPSLDVRTIVLQSVEVGDPEHVRFRASPITLAYADLDEDGREDLQVSLGAIPLYFPPSAFGLFARWVVHAQDYAAVLTAPVAVEPLPSALAFTASIQPNPARSSAVLRMNLPSPGPVAIAMFDVRGREVMRSVRDVPSAGWHDVRLDEVSRFGAGLLFYRVEWKGQVVTGRFVVVP